MSNLGNPADRHGREGSLRKRVIRKGTIETQVSADTNWLQDCCYDNRHDRWFLVNGKRSRVVLRTGTAGEKTLAQFDLNPDWRLYEVLLL